MSRRRDAPRLRAWAGSSRRRSRGVMSREVANFRTFWKATTFSSVLEPTIYLLAFGLGLGSTIVTQRRGARLRRVRRHRHGRDRGDLRQRPAGDVRHLRQAPLPAHLRRDPRRPGRRRGAGHRGGAVDRAARRVLRLLSAAGLVLLRPRPDLGDAAGAVLLLHHGARLRLVRNRGRRHGGEDRPVQLRDHARDHAAVPGRRHLLPDRPAPRGLPGAGAVQPALPAGRARPRGGVRVRGGGRAAGVGADGVRVRHVAGRRAPDSASG